MKKSLAACLMLGLCFGQTTPERDALDQAATRITALREAGQLKEAEDLTRQVLPSPLSEPSKKPGELPVSIYALAWTMLVSEHLKQNDDENAARILTDRIAVSEQTLGRDHPGATGFNVLLASIRMNQGKYDEAVEIYNRLLKRLNSSGVPSEIVTSSFHPVLAQCWLARKNAAKAEALLRPYAQKAQSESQGFDEIALNTYAVALRELGRREEADRLEQLIDQKSHLRRGVNAQRRDFLRARIMTADGSMPEADAIYLHWIGHWERGGEGAWDRILVEPLRAYARFLKQAGRKDEAATVLSRALAIEANGIKRGP